MSTAELLLHPVRLRIAQAFLGERTLTTAELRSELPDVPVATLYRQVAALADAGLLEVVSERRVRGAFERSFRLVAGAASVSAQEAAQMSAQEHHAAFLAFIAGLLADFDRYLAVGGADFARDQAGYRQAGLWLTDGETADLIAELGRVLAPRLALREAPGRRRRLLTTVLMPVPPPGRPDRVTPA